MSPGPRKSPGITTAPQSCLRALSKSDGNWGERVKFWSVSLVSSLIFYFILLKADRLTRPGAIKSMSEKCSYKEVKALLLGVQAGSLN